jgi:hypothetical protein
MQSFRSISTQQKLVLKQTNKCIQYRLNHCKKIIPESEGPSADKSTTTLRHAHTFPNVILFKLESWKQSDTQILAQEQISNLMCVQS